MTIPARTRRAPSKTVLACVAALAALGGVADARAVEAEARVAIEAAPLFGNDAPVGRGFSQIAVSIEAPGSSAVPGTVELRRTPILGDATERTTARFPFEASPGARTTVLVPVATDEMYTPRVVVAAVGRDGKVMDEKEVVLDATLHPLLVDANLDSTLSNALREFDVVYKHQPRWATMESLRLTAGRPARDRAGDGAPTFPDQAAGWAPVTVALLDTQSVLQMSDGERDALASWVLSGGSLALTVSAPEHTRDTFFAKLVGGVATRGEVPDAFANTRAAVIVPAASASSAPSLAPVGERFGETGMWVSRSPEWRTRQTFAMYKGGNLVPNELGASAPYGLGEVHILGFDPHASPNDAWVHGRMLELLARAWDRKAMVLFPHGGATASNTERFLLSNALARQRRTRWTLATSGLLLVLYAFAAGPLLRRLTVRRRRARLVATPALALVGVASVAGVAWAGGRWHHHQVELTVLEGAAGMGRVTARRLGRHEDAFGRGATLKARCEACLIAPVGGTDEASDVQTTSGGVLALVPPAERRRAPRLVREDGFADIGKGVAVLETGDGEYEVINRTGSALTEVVVRVPGRPRLYYVRSLPDGARVRTSDAEGFVYSPTGDDPDRPGHGPQVDEIAAALGGARGPELARAWALLTPTVPRDADFWPADVPVVVGVVRGGAEGHTSILRVLGRGGER